MQPIMEYNYVYFPFKHRLMKRRSTNVPLLLHPKTQQLSSLVLEFATQTDAKHVQMVANYVN